MNTRNVSSQPVELLFQTELLENLLAIEHRYERLAPDTRKKIAVFDLDNTLLVGDIGNAMLAHLMLEGFSLPFAWSDYVRMEEEDPVSAYVEAVKALDGISADYLARATQDLFFSPSSSLHCDGLEIPIPKPNRVMQELVKFLQTRKYTIYVLSASNDLSAKVAGSTLFGIPTENIAGIRSPVFNGRLTHEVSQPIPVGAGKVARYRLMAGDILPIIVATDSLIDIPLLQMCDPYGLAILAGDDERLYSEARMELPLTVSIHRIPRDSALLLQEQHLVA